MPHLRAFDANQVLSRIRVLFGLFCPDFYSDIEDFTQILCRYLPKILAAKTSATHICKMVVGGRLMKGKNICMKCTLCSGIYPGSNLTPLSQSKK